MTPPRSVVCRAPHHLYIRLTAELRSVKDPDAATMPARPEIVSLSPLLVLVEGCRVGQLPQVILQIAAQVKDKRKVQLTFREQYNRLDDRGLRTAEMASVLQEAGWPDAMFMFAVQGADFLDSPNLFVSSPVLSGIFQGAGTLYNFNGRVFSEIQVLANANYAWNRRAPGWVDPAIPRRRPAQRGAQYSAAGATRLFSSDHGRGGVRGALWAEAASVHGGSPRDATRVRSCVGGSGSITTEGRGLRLAWGTSQAQSAGQELVNGPCRFAAPMPGRNSSAWATASW